MPHPNGGLESAFSTFRNRALMALVACLALGLQACGGGGGGGGSGGASSASASSGGSGAPTGTPTLSASTNAVAATASPTDAASDLQVNLSISSPPPTSTYYYETRFAGTAVASASVIWQSTLVNGAQTGLLEITLDPPSLMGSGTYHDTVTVSVCTDSKCADQIAGSPISVTVTYTVTGNAVSDATYAILPNALEFEVPSNGTAPSASIQVTAYEVPPYGAYVFYTSQSGGPIGSMSFKQTSANAEPYSYGTGELTINMKSPESLGPGVYNDLITLSICYDSTCTKPAVGTPFTIPVTYTVTASAGREFQEQTVNQNLTALAVDPTGTVLYGTTAPSTLTSGSVTPPQLVEINPLDGAVTTLLTLPTAVSQIVPSADGAYLYLLTEWWSTIQLSPAIQVLRVQISDMSIDQMVPLTNVTVNPSKIAVSPINSNTWSAAFPSQLNVWEVELFDGQLARPDTWSVTSGVVYGNEGIWSSDASTMYILDANLNAVPVTVSGLGAGTQLQAGSAGQTGFDYGGNLQLADGLIYSANGEVLNPASNSIVGSYSFPSGVPYAELAIDTGNNRLFAAYTTIVNNNAEGTIQSFSLTGFNPIWIARLPVGTQPLRWGSNGLAWLGPGSTAGQSALYLISGTFVAP